MPDNTDLTIQLEDSYLMQNPLDTATFIHPQNKADVPIENEEIKAKFFSEEMTISGSPLLGEGAVGSVHEVIDPALGRKVALKHLKSDSQSSKELVMRFLREGQLTSLIEHPNVIPVYTMGIDKDHGIYYTMKKVKGEDLQVLIEKLSQGDSEYKTKYSRNRLLDIFIAVCNGVAFAHSKGLIHRDIKPANIIIGEYGEVLVSDWGLIKSLEEDSVASATSHDIENVLATETMDGQVAGTPLFIAPEQIMNTPTYKSDQYSLGVTLYHILTYDYPFEQNLNIMDLLKKVYNGVIIPPRKRAPEAKISKALEAICLKAMAQDSNDRYDDINQLISDIQSYRDNKPLRAYKPPIHIRLKKLCLRHPVITAAITATVFGAVIISATLGYILMSRFEGALAVAETNMKQGDSYYQEAVFLIEKTNKLSSDKNIKMENKLKEINIKVDMHYRTAFSEYRSIGPNYKKNQVKNAIKEIFKRRLSLARLQENDNQFRAWVYFIDSWAQNNADMVTDEEARLLDQLRQEVQLKMSQ